ncbi:MarR family transcriptional regulator [Enterococcus sp. 669A]|uniref:MarR family transcriptional regulator n=1 Tax=Candidatus Enterococcus moelleringii TaxID=2815325 RepID=A0ABS3LAH9_9ENTE|nr:MarR family transcriptional regulator [Enterococcus sp. 669A]MBO1306640.1 MarR family transcriptional regulator [Enterococcus sp. 669A]
MDINHLIEAFSKTRDSQQRAIFSSLFILGNRLQTSFDKVDPVVTLKQFMVLTMVKNGPEEGLTLTQVGELLGSSRQTAKKLALSLTKKELVSIQQSPQDKRKTLLTITAAGREYFAKVAALHNEALNHLFEDYTDEEIAQFFAIFMKLYGGAERLERFEMEQGEADK